MTSFLVEPLGATFGARITGATVSALTADVMNELLAEHLVLVFADIELDDDGQQALIGQLGAPYAHPLARVAGATQPRVSHIVDDADHPPYQNAWHTDVTWDPDAPIIGSLRCIEMPARGGDTMWADMYAAYEALSPAFRDALDGLTAWHDAGEGSAFASKAGADLLAKARVEFPGVERPVIATHPVSGRRFVNVNSSFTNHIVGVTDAESTMLLDVLFAHTALPDWQYRHRWTVGELGVWDERATQHYALADHFPARREMARFVVA